MQKKRVIKSGLALSISAGISSVANFLRNVLIARMISVEDFGVAALIGLSMSMVEMLSNLSVDKLLIQAKDADQNQLQATAHAFQILRGILSATLLIIVTPFVVDFFAIPEARDAFFLLALIPAIRGFSHLDVVIQQREMRFLSSILADTGSQFISLLAAWPLAIWLHDYRVMIWALIAQAVTYALTTHLMANKKYQISWNTHQFKRMYSFGWPLIVNSVLVFAIFQGDKAIIGKFYSLETLGWFSAAFGLALAPAMLIPKVLQSLMLPILAKVQDIPESFQNKMELTLALCIFFSLMVSTVFQIFGAELITVIYGQKYAAAGTIIAWLGMMQGVRIAKAGPMIIAMARAETKNAMLSNLSRAFFLGIAIHLAWSGYNISAIVFTGFIAELTSFLISLGLLKWKLNLNINTTFPSLTLGGIIILMTEAYRYATSFYAFQMHFIFDIAYILSVCMIFVLFTPTLTEQVKKTAQSFRRG